MINLHLFTTYFLVNLFLYIYFYFAYVKTCFHHFNSLSIECDLIKKGLKCLPLLLEDDESFGEEVVEELLEEEDKSTSLSPETTLV